MKTEISRKNLVPSPRWNPPQRSEEFPRESLRPLREYFPDEFLLTAKNHKILACFWAISSNRLAEMMSERRADLKYQEIIRLTWSEQSLFDPNYKLLPTTFSSRREWISVPFPSASYRAELGWLGKDGGFISVLISNPLIPSQCLETFTSIASANERQE